MHHPSEAVAYSRLLRPYSTARLDRALWYVESNAGSIRNRKLLLLLEPPVDPDRWVFELQQIQNDLETLSEQCEDAWRRIDLLKRSAPGDYERAVTAMRAMLVGMSEAPTQIAA